SRTSGSLNRGPQTGYEHFEHHPKGQESAPLGGLTKLRLRGSASTSHSMPLSSCRNITSDVAPTRHIFRLPPIEVATARSEA
ncbi:MAG: hypothetical protein ACREMQ_09650, partial [Longimicrobiales bacterium]